MVNPISYCFYADGSLLFSLERAEEYDTATPYRYAVSRFVDLAERIKTGQSISVRAGENQAMPLQTVADLMSWIFQHFAGFEKHMA